MTGMLADLGVIKITWYSIMILSGVIIAGLLIIKEAKKYNINNEFITNLIFWTIFFGIIGARLYYVAFEWSYYSSHIDSIWKIWEGGLAIHGGIITGLLFIIFYCNKYKVKIFKVLDITVVGLIIAQALGRWGNFFNGEAHGPETTALALEKIGIIPRFVIEGMSINGVYYQPTFYYEFLWCMLGFIILLLVRWLYKYLKTGQLTAIYFMWYSVGRFFIEGMRTDSLMLGNIKVAQVVSVLLFIVGLFIFIKNLRGSKLENLYKEEYISEIKF
jgi:phosphatidylglycerol:prolipoprotein diacylglycerol transferase